MRAFAAYLQSGHQLWAAKFERRTESSRLPRIGELIAGKCRFVGPLYQITLTRLVESELWNSQGTSGDQGLMPWIIQLCRECETVSQAYERSAAFGLLRLEAFDEVLILRSLMADYTGLLAALFQIRYQRIGQSSILPRNDL